MSRSTPSTTTSRGTTSRRTNAAALSRTDINFQRVPTIDTSNPFICRNIPTPDESFVIIHFRKGAREKWGIDFSHLLRMIHDSFMSSPTSIVVNGGKMGFAMELILTPIIHRMIKEKS